MKYIPSRPYRYGFSIAGLALALVTFDAAFSQRGSQGARSQFSYVWNALAADSYDRLPQREVSLSSFGLWFSNRLRAAADRTLTSHDDFRETAYRKLVHPNGICLAGTWKVDSPTQYTGYFATGSEGMIIARASTALSNTRRGDYRAFGFAGKIYPTNDPQDTQAYRTANFFLVDDLGGTMADHFGDIPLSNEPDVTIAGRGAYVTAIGAATGLAFSHADNNPGLRQLYEISELSLNDPAQAVTPYYMRIKRQGSSALTRTYADFRNELAVDNFAAGLAFDIEVSENKTTWTRIGEINFIDSVASNACDTQLHFPHPVFRDDLTHGQ